MLMDPGSLSIIIIMYPHCNRLLIASRKQPGGGRQDSAVGPSGQLIESVRRESARTSSFCVLDESQVTSNSDNQLAHFRNV